MFVNYTNHPSAAWSPLQLSAARQYGEITDLIFPNVPPDVDEKELDILAENEFRRIISCRPEAVLCQGEMTLTYRIVRLLSQAGIPALAACSERVEEERITADGSTRKMSVFAFRRFRLYQTDVIPEREAALPANEA